jgi:hypothetical protein
MKTTAILIFSLTALAALVNAADVTGKWKGNLEGQNGSREITFTLKADGGELSGKVAGLLDRELDVQEGKVRGSAITFSVMSEWEGNPVKLVYKGELTGDVIHFTMGTEDGSWSTELTAKRVSS